MKNCKDALLRKAKGYLFFFSFLFFSSSLFAQTPVKGKLYDNNGTPLTGASVVVKGTTRGTTTNSLGEFSINASPGEVLEISMVGFQAQTLKLDGNSGEITLRL